jgi:predicted porin
VVLTCAKSLLAVAIAAAVPVVASAQVTIGGLMDIGITSVDNGQKTKTMTTTGDRSSNNLNFRGVEDIGGGLKGVFHLELGFDVDNGLFNGGLAGPASGSGSGALPVLNSGRQTSSASITPISGFGFTRRSIVGLQGGFGEIRGGRDYTPIFLAVNGNSIHGTSGYASTLTYFNGNSLASGTSGTGITGHDVRFNNAVFYDSPVMGGFKLTAAFTNASGFEEAYNTKNGVGTSFAGVYNNGPLYAQVSMSSQKIEDGTGTALVNTNPPGKREATAYGVKYTIGDIQLAAGGQNAKVTNGPASCLVPGNTSAAGVCSANVGNNNMVENKVVFLGAAYTFGPNRLSVQGAQVKVSGSTGSAGAGVDKDYSALTVLLNHSLSKRTSLYANYGQIKNDANQNVLIRSNGAAFGTAALGKDPSAFGVGLVHSF